ncbi:MAG: hypothetical protein KKA28_09855 [Planctomycetes bacterium]|nr:hypothetical protein [Planctomycetota bacterium]
MGLLDKTNRKATPKSVLIHGIIGAIVGCAFFFLAFKSQFVQEWKILLPIWLLLCAGVSALCEWQIDDSDEDEEDK